MNKKLKTLCYSLMVIIGLCFTTNVSAKVCNYEYTSKGYVQSGYSNMSDYIKVKVSYDESSICYYVNGSKGACFTGNSPMEKSELLSSGVIVSKVPISTWIADSDGCIDNLNVATGQVTKSGIAVSAYVFATDTESVAIDNIVLTPSASKFLSAEEELTVTYIMPDGSKQSQKVAFGGEAFPVDVVAGEGKDFVCWKKEGDSGCFDFTTKIKYDLTLTTETRDQEYLAGFEQFGNNTTCNGQEIPYGLPYMISRIISLIKIITPIILIILGMFDYGKAAMSNDEKKMKQSSAAFVRRVIAAVLIFFVVAIIQFGFGLLGDSGSELFECFDCFTNGNCTIIQS